MPNPSSSLASLTDSSRKEEAWRDQLDIVRRSIEGRLGLGPGRPVDSRWTPPARILYAINLEQSLRTGDLTIDFLQRQRNKSGELGRLKPLSMDEDRLALVDPADAELLSVLMALPVDAKSTTVRSAEGSSTTIRIRRGALAPALFSLVLPGLCATERLIWNLGRDHDLDPMAPLQWDEGEAYALGLRLEATESADHAALHGELVRDEETVPVEEPRLNLASGLVLFEDRIARLELGNLFSWTVILRSEGPIEIPYPQLPEALEELWRHPELPQLELPEELRLPEISLPPRPRLTVLAAPAQRTFSTRTRVAFLYDGIEVESGDTRRALLDRAGRRLLLRDPMAEQQALDSLDQLGFQPGRGRRENGTYTVPNRRVAAVLEELLAAGWLLRAEDQPVRRAGGLSFGITTGIDWFELDGGGEFEGRVVPMPQILQALERKERFLVLDDGSLGILPEVWVRQLDRFRDLATDEDSDRLRFQPSQALLIEALLSENDFERDQQFDQLRSRLASVGSVEAQEEPPGFVGTLRPYQRLGLGWLEFLRDLGLGGCLADDMGLGKTVQVLALLQGESQTASDRPLALVVAPRSLIYNWVDETARFAPDLEVRTYLGAQRKKQLAELEDADLLITTYGTLRRDITTLRKHRFRFVILDEAQAIKNAGSQTARATRLLRADHRLALTGTPIENHLGELWSIFEFLNPGMLGRVPRLEGLVDPAEEGDGGKPELRRALAPFILRRTKEQVLSELPAKTEQVLRCQLSKAERTVYDELKTHYRSSLVQRFDEVGLKRSKIEVLEALLRLRQASCHPGLLDDSKRGEPSTKVDLLQSQLEEVLQSGHKALVFSQFTSLLAIVQDRLREAGIVYEYLDGKTRDRGARVERFQTDPDCPVFLISLKAGGVGLNLTAASYVYLLDPWWNPAVEAQAIDRAHRIGQDQPVFAYRLIAEETVEEKILMLQDTKRDLAEAILEADGTLVQQMGAEDLLWLLD